MKARETALRLKRFELDEKARKVADLEQMIREFEAIASDLDRQISAEEDRTGIKDTKHFAYSFGLRVIVATSTVVDRLDRRRVRPGAFQVQVASTKS